MTGTEQTTDNAQLQVGDIVERIYVALTLLGGVFAVLVVVRALLGGRLAQTTSIMPDDNPKA
jgi:hypothetical protein